MNKPNRNRLIDTEDKLTAARGDRAGELGEEGEGTETCRLELCEA